VPAVDDHLSRLFSALADPTRRQILSRLSRGSTTVGTIAEPLNMTGPAVSQHLKVLERAGLVAREPRAQWRIISLRREPLDEVAEWIDAHRRDWNERLDQLEGRIQQRNAKDSGARPR
jgi:DNA-binding transcriptional ArsR family regulator